MAPSETDPLLPQGSSAPEISGHGFSRASKAYQSQSEIVDENEYIEDRSAPTQSSRSFLSLRVPLVLFTMLVGLAIIISLLARGTSDTPRHERDGNSSNIEARVNKILNETPLIDGHDDLAILIRYAFQNDIYGQNFTKQFEDGPMLGQVDLPRLRNGEVGGSFWSAFVLCPQNGTDFSDANYVEAVSTTLSQIDLIHRLTASYPKVFSNPNLNSTRALAAFEEDHTLISPIGIEGLHQIGNSFSNLRLYHSLGVKYATLTHNCNNAFADAALTTTSSGQTVAGPAYWNGLSEKGMLVVKEMNRIGMLIDLAHVSPATMSDVLGGTPQKTPGSAAPIIFSHSSAYALCPHPRNVPDSILHLVKRTNSLVMVNFSPDFISCTPSNSTSGIPDLYPPNATLHQVARHITYIGDLIGYDHVGLGSDFDGIPTTPSGLEDVSKFPDLVAELLSMGVSDEDAKKIVGGNLLRVWKDAEKVAAKMQSEGVLPIQDHIEKITF